MIACPACRRTEGRAITGGVAYHGRIAALRGKYVFGDIHGGRVFLAPRAAGFRRCGVAIA